MKTRPNILLFVFVAVVVFCLGGCSSSDPWSKLGFGTKLGLDVVKYKPDLGKKISTTPVHPDDSSFLSGETTAYPKGDVDVAPKLGIFSSIGSESLKIVAGIDGRLNPLHQSDWFREGMYSTRQQSSDFRPPEYGSFVFTQVTPGWYTLIPSVGIEGKLGEKLILGGSIGFPYMGWEARSGHDRYAYWETVQRDSWKGFGIRYDIALGFKVSDETKFLVSYFDEEYEPEFAGEGATISGRGLLFSFVYSF